MTLALSRPSRRLVPPLLLAGALLLTGVMALQSLEAQALRNHNSNAPVDFAADRIELQDRQDRVVFAGNVDVSQAGLRLRAERMTVAYRNGDGLEIDRIDASGGVSITKGDETARGNVGIYDFDRRIITLVGNVSLRQGTNTVNGARLVIDLASGRSTMDGRASGATEGVTTSGDRVTGRFSVPRRDGAETGGNRPQP